LMVCALVLVEQASARPASAANSLYIGVSPYVSETSVTPPVRR
jgi:hypothetical protein